jgi:hypothetical protein
MIKRKKKSPPKAQIDQFFEWLEENPEFFHSFVEYTFRVINAGFTTYSSDAIFHVLRWNLEIEVEDSDPLVNDNGKPIKIRSAFTPYMARYFMYLYPDHGPYIDADGDEQSGFFETCRLRDPWNRWGDEWWKVRVLSHRKAA